MNPLEYTARLMKLGFETGRGNPNAFNESFGDIDHDCHLTMSGEGSCDHPSHKGN